MFNLLYKGFSVGLYSTNVAASKEIVAGDAKHYKIRYQK